MPALIQDRLCCDYEENLRRQKDFIEDLRKQVTRLEKQNEVLESRVNDKDREIQDFRRRALDAETSAKRNLHGSLKSGEELAKKEDRLHSTVTALKDAQALLKVAEGKIESQKKEIASDKQQITDLRQMNVDLKNKFEGLLALRRRTERDCAMNEGKTLEKQKQLDEAQFNNENLAKKLEEANEKNEQLKSAIEKVPV
jgi:chromosome segregation ATPase